MRTRREPLIIPAVLALVAVAVSGCGGGASSTVGSTNGTTEEAGGTGDAADLAAIENEVFRLVNQARVANGLQALALATDLSDVARAHSQDMIARDFFGHFNPDGQDAQARMEAAGIHVVKGGENIHKNADHSTPARTAVNEWLASPGHYAIMMLDTVDETGVGVALSNDGYFYFTQLFCKRMKVFEQSALRDEESNLLDQINQQRATAGVPALTMASDVSEVARQHSQDMAQPGYIDLEGPQIRLSNAGINADWVYEWTWYFWTDGPVATKIIAKMLEKQSTITSITSDLRNQAGIGIYQHTDGLIYVTVTLVRRT